MSRQSIIVSIQGIEYTIRQLKDLVVELNFYLVTEPDKILADAVSVGFPVEIEQRYRSRYLVKNVEDAKLLINSIYKFHIPYLESVVQDLKRILDR